MAIQIQKEATTQEKIEASLSDNSYFEYRGRVLNFTVRQLAITTAMVRLQARQTEDERNCGTTIHQNGRGWSKRTEGKGTWYAQYALGATRYNKRGVVTPEQWDMEVAKLKRGERTSIRLMNGSFLDKGQDIALIHIKQLVEVADAKRALQAAKDELSERQAIQEEACDSSDDERCPPTMESNRGTLGAVTMRP